LVLSYHNARCCHHYTGVWGLTYTLAEAAVEARIECVGQARQAAREAPIAVVIAVVGLCCRERAPYRWKDLRLETTDITRHSSLYIQDSDLPTELHGAVLEELSCSVTARRFITVFTTAFHWSLPEARRIQTIPSLRSDVDPLQYCHIITCRSF
jgi:hypothetical protein